VPIKRNEFLCSAGDVCTSLFLIESGAFRAYRIEDGEEQSIRFGYQGSILVALDAYFSESTTHLYIQALRKATVSIIPKSTVDRLIDDDDQFKSAYLKLLENFSLQQMEREIDLLTQSPQERYSRVLQRSPALFQEIPLKYIASYLRMSPETLSRLRKS